MPSSAVLLPKGQNVIAGRYEDVEADLLENGPLVQLSGVIRPVAGMPALGSRGATKMEVHMEPKAAIELASRIYALALKMGWPLPSITESQDAQR
jgi:hypothetical protein